MTKFNPGYVMSRHVGGGWYIAQDPEEAGSYCETCGDSDQELGYAATVKDYIAIVILDIYSYSNQTLKELLEFAPELFYKRNEWGELIKGKFEFNEINVSLIQAVIQDNFGKWQKLGEDE